MCSFLVLDTISFVQGTGRWATTVLAYKTLGVVFGGLVTSPLYVYPSMQLKSPTEDDYLGIYCIIFWTLSLIGVVKYAWIALKADDQGEGNVILCIRFFSVTCLNHWIPAPYSFQSFVLCIYV